VIFHGGFTREGAAAVYRSMDVLVVPSLWPENSPLVIHEAFQHRVPVVGARSGGIAGLIREDVDGLLYEPFDTHALAELLQRLVDDSDLAVRLSAAAPPVKSMAQDAAEWSARYSAVRGRARVTAVV
jgi:glycosyltransferase involved in cell wall biosynthesis